MSDRRASIAATSSSSAPSREAPPSGTTIGAAWDGTPADGAAGRSGDVDHDAPDGTNEAPTAWPVGAGCGAGTETSGACHAEPVLGCSVAHRGAAVDAGAAGAPHEGADGCCVATGIGADTGAGAAGAAWAGADVDDHADARTGSGAADGAAGTGADASSL